MRHRLQKEDPSAPVSEAVEPIVYYVDRAIPEPIRSAVLEGVGWWTAAFEAAGYRHAFRVELAPEGMDLLDVRNNVVQWVHRSTRGWSYGNSVIDPRTGEIIKGHISLGSLRVRQDQLLMEGLAPHYEAAGDHNCAVGLGPTGLELAAFDPNLGPTEIALARIRQLACHEVGHTLGLAHNFAASTYDRGSVMDYPAPLAKITGDNKLDLSDAYSVGIASWDSLTVRYAYEEFPEGVDEDSALAAIVAEAVARDLIFVSDADSRSDGAAHPLSNLWDNGADPVAEMERIMDVRRIGLNEFGENSVREGEPSARLEEILVPLYLGHRYQIDAAAKSIGGAEYTYAMSGDGQTPISTVSPDRQRQALATLLRTIHPSELILDDRVLALLPPQPYGYWDDRERFAGKTGRLFDPLTAAEVAAAMTIDNLLQSERAARLIVSHRRDNTNLSLEELIDRIIAATWTAETPTDEYPAAVARVVEQVVVGRLIELAKDMSTSGEVRAVSSLKLRELSDIVEARANLGTVAEQAHHVSVAAEISRFLMRPYDPDEPTDRPETPPGSPIGDSR
jgi:hypothetical protein